MAQWLADLRGGLGLGNKVQKPISMLADKRSQRRQAMVLDFKPPAEPPPPLPKLMGGKCLAATEALWGRFWTSPIAQLVNRESDMPRLARWIYYCDEWLRALRSFRNRRLVTGSQGQPVINPLGDYVLKLEKQIAAVEEKFGLTPLDRMRLGITFGEARRSLASLNAELDEDDGESDYEMPEGKAAK